MDTISVVVFLVRCSADLLACQTLPTDYLRYTEMETCRAEVARMVSDSGNEPGRGVLMGKCIYRMSHADQRRTHRHEVFAKGDFRQAAGLMR